MSLLYHSLEISPLLLHPQSKGKNLSCDALEQPGGLVSSAGSGIRAQVYAVENRVEEKVHDAGGGIRIPDRP